jgi:GNAT superfamily N-acetyltransferase
VLSVRDALPTDAMDVAAVHVRSWQAGYRGLLPDSYLDALKPEDRASRYTFGLRGLDQPTTVVALEGRAIRGFAAIGPAQDAQARGIGELRALYVDPGYWGRGVGRLLIGSARVRLLDQGFAEAIVWVLSGNQRAERFYLRDGWTPDQTRREEEVWGVKTDQARFWRSLP